MLLGIDPLELTLLTFALAVVVLPFAIVPLLLLSNDSHYVGEHRSHKLTNTIVILIILLAAVLAVVAILLEILGGG